MQPNARSYSVAATRRPSGSTSVMLKNLNLAVVGGELPPESPLHQQPTDPVLPRPSSDDLFASALHRMEVREAENRHSGNFFLIVEPYKPTTKSQPSTPSTPGKIINRKPKSRLSLERSVISAVQDLNKVPISARRPASSRLGPGSYEGIVSRLADSAAPRVTLHKFDTKATVQLGYGTMGPGRYTVDDSAIRRRAPSALMSRPHPNFKDSEIARLIDKEYQIGPGTYELCEPNRHGRSTARIQSPTNCFENTTSLYELQDRPGPGSYTIHDEQIRARPPSASFSRARLRSVFDLGNDDPGPGSYNLPDTLRETSNARVGTFGTASRFANGGRVYQRIKEFHFKKVKPKPTPEQVLASGPTYELQPSQPEMAPNVPGKAGSKIRPKSISKVMREERERKKDVWRAKLLALDISALALDAQTEYRPIEEQRKRIQTRWLQLMPVASRTIWFSNLLQTYRINRDQIVRAKSAATRIQRWFRCICAARRLREIRRLEHMFGRILLKKFRARQFRRIAAKKHQAAEIIKVMLVFEKRKLLKGVKTFRHKVLRLQNWWKQYLRQCAAILAAFEKQWISFEDRIFTFYAEEEVKHAMTKAAKHTKASSRRQTTAAIRDEIAVPRASQDVRRAAMVPIVKERYRACIASRRKWDGNKPQPWISVMLPPLQILDMIKTAQDSVPEEIMPKVVKLKLQKFIRRLVQQYSQ